MAKEIYCSEFDKSSMRTLAATESASRQASNANIDDGRYINLKSWLMGARHEMFKEAE